MADVCILRRPMGQGRGRVMGDGRESRWPIHRVRALLSAWLVSAAVTVPLAVYGGTASGTEAAAEGYIYVQLPRTDPVSPPRLSVESTTSHKEFELEPRIGGRPNEYGAWVPAGNYVPSLWRRFQWGEYPGFEVQAGRVTDLGTLVPVQIGGSRFVIVPVRVPEEQDHVKDVVKAYASKLSEPQPIVWSPGVVSRAIQVGEDDPPAGLIIGILSEIVRSTNEPPLNERLRKVANSAEFIALAKSGVPPLTPIPAVDGDGNLYFGAALGQVRVRASDGRWHSSDTGTLETITAVSVQGDTLYAGSLNGGLFVSRDRANSWSRLPSIDSKRDVRVIDRVGSQWFVVATHPALADGKWYSANKVSVYGSDGATPEGLRLIAEADIDAGQAYGIWSGPATGVQSGTYFVNLMNKLVGINLSTLERTTVKIPTIASGLAVSTDGSVMSIFFRKGIFSNLFVSRDGGANWNKLAAPPYIIEDVYFRNPRDGVAIRSNGGVMTATLEVLAYLPDKNDWQKQYEAPVGCVRLLWDAAMQPSFCVLGGGSILHYANGRWQGEFAAD